MFLEHLTSDKFPCLGSLAQPPLPTPVPGVPGDRGGGGAVTTVCIYLLLVYSHF